MTILRAALFDKDGTLFDFRASWGGWTRMVLADLVPQDPKPLAEVLGYDLERSDFHPGSIVIGETTAFIARAVASHLGHSDASALTARLAQIAAAAPMHPAVDLRATFEGLRALGLTIGLCTNDTEVPANQHLRDAGIAELFDHVLASNSGYGGKPEPGPLLAFARLSGVRPDEVVMVGDSLHDMEAARRAGMPGLAVLTGIAARETLAPHAEAVLPDISHLAGWIAARNAACAG